MYKHFLRPLLFSFNAERAHKLFLSFARIAGALPFGRQLIRLFHKRNTQSIERELFGIHFPNPVGLAAGFDRNADCIMPMSDFGFGFIEVGSVTPLAQGDAFHPSTQRLRKDLSIASKGNTANKGLKYVIGNLQHKSNVSVVGASLSPSLSSSKDEEIRNDFLQSFSLLYDFVDFFTINLASPNENGILAIQNSVSAAEIIDPVLELRLCEDTVKPVLIKVTTDIPEDQLEAILDYCLLSGIDGIIVGAGSRTPDTAVVSKMKKAKSMAGCSYSGALVYNKTLEMVRKVSSYTKGRFPIVASGGIMSPEQAQEMLDAGASLIQLYTGLIYEGPSLVRRIVKQLNINELAKKQI